MTAPGPGQGGAQRSVRGLGIALALLVVPAVLILEAAFRVGGLLVIREPQPASDGSRVVLAVGDSHTRGRPDPDNYPYALEQLLRERTGERYRVINVGIPGQNTAQVRNRFERYLAYYRPELVLHFGGVNNLWNQIETSVWDQSLLDRLVASSRVARFLRVAFFYGALSGAVAESPQFELVEWAKLDSATYRVNFGGVGEEIRTDAGTGERLSDESVERVTYDDLAAMLDLSKEQGIPMYLVMYPVRDHAFEPVNRAVARVSEERGIPWVDSPRALAGLRRRVGVEELFDVWAHPAPVLYRQIAEEAYQVLAAEGHVPPAPTALPDPRPTPTPEGN